MGGYQLSVDFGTSSTVAVLAGPDGVHHPLLFDGEEFLPSATCLDNAPHLLVGRDALVLGQAHPDRLAAYPKRAADSGAVVLGGVECPVGDLYAAVFARVAAEARRVAGEPMSTVTLTHPACWDRRRQATLTRAAAKVGLSPTRLLAEPVAAALHVVDSGILEVPAGSSLIVYDLGAGTFDAAVVRRSAGTFEVLAQRGLPDAGGLDLDAAVVAHLGNLLADDTIRWERLTRPQTVEDRRAARRLLDEARVGKEMLSVAESTTVLVPLFEESVPLTRADLERIARPLLDRTVAATVAATAEPGVTRAEVAGVLLIGGSSRIPLVARLLRDALGVEPTAIRRPKLAVADGCLPVFPAPRPAAPAAPSRPCPAPVAAPAVTEPPAADAPDAGVPPFEPAAFGPAKAPGPATGAVQPRQWPEPPVVELIDVPGQRPPSLLDRLRRRRPHPAAATTPAAGATAHPAASASRGTGATAHPAASASRGTGATAHPAASASRGTGATAHPAASASRGTGATAHPAASASRGTGATAHPAASASRGTGATAHPAASASRGTGATVHPAASTARPPAAPRPGVAGPPPRPARPRRRPHGSRPRRRRPPGPRRSPPAPSPARRSRSPPASGSVSSWHRRSRSPRFRSANASARTAPRPAASTARRPTRTPSPPGSTPPAHAPTRPSPTPCRNGPSSALPQRRRTPPSKSPPVAGPSARRLPPRSRPARTATSAPDPCGSDVTPARRVGVGGATAS
ncbi:Hsp70 family protein [Dactylosporangium sp. NBC_01737]|nr:Hsp70 family protein [Dactylosporangium sp. NBC_01737]